MNIDCQLNWKEEKETGKGPFKKDEMIFSKNVIQNFYFRKASIDKRVVDSSYEISPSQIR